MIRIPGKGSDLYGTFNAGIRKIFLYGMITMMIGVLSLCQEKIVTSELPPEEPAQVISEESQDGGMSAVRLTTLPFILAFNHFVADREV